MIGENRIVAVSELFERRAGVFDGEKNAAYCIHVALHRPNEERDKPRSIVENNTAGVREREDANRTREAGNLDEIQGSVANTLNLYRNGDSLLAKPFGVRSIAWLGPLRRIMSRKFG